VDFAISFASAAKIKHLMRALRAAKSEPRDIANWGRYPHKSRDCAEAEVYNIQRRGPVHPNDEIERPLCGANSHQEGPECVPKFQEEIEHKTRRMRKGM
jgi:hypothetical protein